MDGDDADYYQEDDYDDVPSDDDDDQSGRTDQPCVKVINKESLLAAQTEDLRRVMDLLSLREHHARALLIHFRWNVDKLTSVFGDRGPNQLYSLAGIVLDEDRPSFVLDSSTVDCQVCFEKVASTEVLMMDCGHHYCKNCWSSHFTTQIQEGRSKHITCIAYKCNVICDEEIVRDLVSLKDISIAEKFENFLLKSYVEDNNMVKWCPSVPHCGNAISVEGDVVCEVKCTCELEFCFSCLAEAHSPCSCNMWRLWAKKCFDESETANWITVNTKPCPKCFKPVDKDGGCNLVRCICGQSMCWLCGAPTGFAHTWTYIEGHDCGKYKTGDQDDKDIELARKRLLRYTHYYNHFKAHTDSLKLESELKKKVADRITSLEDLDYASKDYTWLADGINRLLRARRILAYSYPFAYYMFGDELFTKEMTKSDKILKQNLFENQQQEFAGMVERLSHVLKAKIANRPTVDELNQLKSAVLNLSSLTDSLCREMYSCIESDLLGPLSTGALHEIAAYQSKGITIATEFGI